VSKKSKSSTSGTSTTQMDPAQKAMMLDAYGRIQDATSQPYEAYGGQTFAGPTQNTQDAWGMATNLATSNLGGAALNSAMQGTQQAMGYNPMQVGSGSVLDNVGNYMNPYLDQVMNNALGDLDRSRMLTQQGNAFNADAAKAFGGDRHGIVEAETNRDYLSQAGNLATQMRSQAFNSALGMAGSDLDRQQQSDYYNQTAGYNAANLGLTASGQMANLSDQQRQQAYGDAAVLEGVGSAQQQQQQAGLDDEYSKWLEAQNYDLNMAGILGNYVSGMPSMGGTTSSTGKTTSTPSTWDSLMKVGSTAASFMSDENIKSGRRKASPEKALRAIEQTPVEQWNYDTAKGGPDDGGVEHIGPMAQSVKKNLGIGNGRMIPVVDMMGTQMAATQALAKKVKKLEGKKGKK
jgi:hypothetical protein